MSVEIKTAAEVVEAIAASLRPGENVQAIIMGIWMVHMVSVFTHPLLRGVSTPQEVWARNDQIIKPISFNVGLEHVVRLVRARWGPDVQAFHVTWRQGHGYKLEEVPT